MNRLAHALALSLWLAPVSAGAQPVGTRCLVVGDSNAILPASELIMAGTLPPSAVVFDFAAVAYGTGLRDIESYEARLADPRLAEVAYDCAIVSLGVNDLLYEDADWMAFFAGLRPGGMPYRRRIERLLAALPDAPIYWLGVPQGSPLTQLHPWEIAAVNLSALCFEDPAALGTWCPPGARADARFRYVDPEQLIGTTSPRFADEVHYSPTAARALFWGVVGRILEGR